MSIAEIISADHARIVDNVVSKKRALETLSEILGEAAPYASDNEIFTALVGREKLGSTGVGDGVGIPHGRLKGIDNCVGALIRLDKGIDFEAPDDAPVDILFGLLVPQESSEEHLIILRSLAELFSESACLQKLRDSADGEAMVACLREFDNTEYSETISQQA